jgi:hypothetical protein
MLLVVLDVSPSLRAASYWVLTDLRRDLMFAEYGSPTNDALSLVHLKIFYIAYGGQGHSETGIRFHRHTQAAHPLLARLQCHSSYRRKFSSRRSARGSIYHLRPTGSTPF